MVVGMGNCIYPKCESAGKCRKENERYTGCHSDWSTECPDGEFGHLWICDTHNNLLEFLRLSGVLELEVKVRGRR